MCQRVANATAHTKISTTLTRTSSAAFDTLVIHTIGPLLKTENTNEYAITLICDLTKYLESQLHIRRSKLWQRQSSKILF